MFAAGCWVWLRPFELHQSPIEIILHNSWGLIWAFTSIGFIYIYALILLLLVRIALFRASAVYVSGNRLIYMFPFILGMDLAKIRSVAFLAPRNPLEAGRIIVNLQDDEAKSFKVGLFVDRPSDVVEKIKLCASRDARNCDIASSIERDVRGSSADAR